MNDQRYDFVSVQVDYWDNPWQNRHALVSEMSKKHRIFFLSPPFYLVDLLPGGRKRTKLQGFSVIKENLYSYVPPRYLPYNYRFPRIDNFVRRARHNKIRNKLREIGFASPILYLWHPNYADMIGEFGESLVVYHKYDHYAGYIGGSGGIGPQEKKLMEIADLVFVTSQGLYDLHKDDCKEIHLLPNGVDFDFFSKAMTDDVHVPSEIAEIPQPRIGYIGVINEKVNFKLLTFLCKARPDWSIVLVGPEKVTLPEFRENLRELQRHTNCYFLGRKEITEVPAYIKGLDVCMMCYLVNEWTYYGYPLKMHEYLACGKPCVSADLPAVRDFSAVLSIATSEEEWLDMIEANITNNYFQLEERRLQVARENSWSARVREIVRLVGARM